MDAGGKVPGGCGEERQEKSIGVSSAVGGHWYCCVGDAIQAFFYCPTTGSVGGPSLSTLDPRCRTVGEKLDTAGAFGICTGQKRQSIARRRKPSFVRGGFSYVLPRARAPDSLLNLCVSCPVDFQRAA